MTLTRSLPTQFATGIPLIDERRVVAGLFVRNTDGTARTGILPAHANPLVTGRASMSYDIAAFNAVSTRTAAGAEQVANDGTVTFTPTSYAAPAANSRVDVIWFQCQFVILGDTKNDVVFGVTQGTPSATTPTKPSIPAGAVELAMVTMPSTATTTLSSGVVIQPTFQYTAAAGGTVWFRNATDLAAWTPANGAQAFRIDTGEYYQRRNGAWQLAGGDTGWIPLTLSTGWAAVAGHTPRGRLMNGVVYLEGAVIRGSGGLQSNVAVIPPELRILGPGKTTFIGATFSSRSTGGAATSQMYTGESGVIGIEGYTTMDGTVGWVLPLTCDFPRDQR